MELQEYIKQNQPKGRFSKKYLKDHNKSLHAAWYHIYVTIPNNIIKQANKIINKTGA